MGHPMRLELTRERLQTMTPLKAPKIDRLIATAIDKRKDR